MTLLSEGDHCRPHWWKLEGNFSWSGIRIWHGAFSKIWSMDYFNIICYRQIWSILFFFWSQYFSSFISIHVHVRSKCHKVSTVRFIFHLKIYFLCQTCQCNKVLYTVEFSAFPVIWLFLCLTLGEASSAVVHLNTVIDEMMRNRCTESSSTKYSVHL